ncbi:hypothetical protein ZWY2020_040876 [Hordeum vulgare]|nr:hypothetical protein ZWY2020_040876 [Hordeum vulgare]
MKLASSIDSDINEASKLDGATLEKKIGSIKNTLDAAAIPAARKADLKGNVSKLEVFLPSTPRSGGAPWPPSFDRRPCSRPPRPHGLPADRFIPTRTRTNLAPPSATASSSGSAASPHQAILRAVLFGPDTPDRLASSAAASSSSPPVGSPVGGNIFLCVGSRLPAERG